MYDSAGNVGLTQKESQGGGESQNEEHEIHQTSQKAMRPILIIYSLGLQ